MDYHKQGLLLCCRVCGNRLVAAKGKKDAVYQCKDFSANLQAAFCITANADVPGVHPSHFCSSCKRAMDKITSANENKMPFRTTREEFLWVAHTDEQCKVWDKFRNIDNVHYLNTHRCVSILRRNERVEKENNVILLVDHWAHLQEC